MLAAAAAATAAVGGEEWWRGSRAGPARLRHGRVDPEREEQGDGV